MKTKIRIKGWLILVSIAASITTVSSMAQVTTKGLAPGSNTSSAYQDSSIARDSGLGQPLSLLNDFYPSIEVSVTDHSNVRARPDFEEGDLKFVAKPSLAYRTNFGRHEFYAAYNGMFTFHQDVEQENASSHSIDARAGIDISRSWDLDLYAGFGDVFEQRGGSGSRPFDPTLDINNGPNKIDYRAYGADLAYGRKLGKLIAALGFERAETGFTAEGSSDAIVAGNRDRQSDSVHFDLSYKIAPKTSIFGRVQKTDVDYDRSTNSLDSEQTNVMVGVRWKPTKALSGVVGVGRTTKDFEDSSLDGYEGSSYYANLNYSISPFSNIQIGLSRAIEEPSDINASYYESDLVGVSWEHSLTPQLIFNVFAKQLEDDYDSSRHDRFNDWGFGLDYAWKDWMTAGIYYGSVVQDSTSDEFDYSDDYFGIRLTSDLRPLLRNRGKQQSEPASFRPNKKSERVKR